MGRDLGWQEHAFLHLLVLGGTLALIVFLLLFLLFSYCPLGGMLIAIPWSDGGIRPLMVGLDHYHDQVVGWHKEVPKQAATPNGGHAQFCQATRVQLG